jgi:hypothetical protein
LLLLRVRAEVLYQQRESLTSAEIHNSERLSLDRLRLYRYKINNDSVTWSPWSFVSLAGLKSLFSRSGTGSEVTESEWNTSTGTSPVLKHSSAQ